MDNLLYQMEFYMSKSPFIKEDSVKFHELGHVGGAVVDTWMQKHCSLKTKNENVTKSCMSCFSEYYGKINETINCSNTFLPKQYEKCWVGLIFRYLTNVKTSSFFLKSSLSL